MAIRCKHHARESAGPERLMEELRCTPLFQALDNGGLRQLLSQARERHYCSGEVLFHEGDPVHTLYFLRGGSAKAVAVGDDGRESVLNILVAGDLFPHVGFKGDEVYPAAVQAIDCCDVLLCQRSDLEAAMRRYGDFALAYTELMVEQIRWLQSRVRDLAGRDLSGRVAVALLRLLEKENCRYKDSCLLGHRRIHLTHQEIAGMVGASREAVSRVLSGFKSDGCVASGPDGVVVVDREKLLASL